MLSNIIGPFPKKSEAPSDKVEKASGYYYEIKEPVVTISRNYLDNKKGEYQEISLSGEVLNIKGLV